MIKKQNQDVAIRRRRYITISAIVVAVLIILWAGWWLIFKHNAYSPNKDSVRKDAQSLLSSVSFKGTQVYSALVDQGCNSNHIEYAIFTSCDYKGYKYFLSKDELAQNLKDADTQITKAGWTRTYSPQGASSLDVMLKDSNHQSISYANPFGMKYIGATLSYYQDGQNSSNQDIVSLIKNGKILVPKDNDYIYGVAVRATYWSCDNYNSWFKICPLPPSSPKSY